MSEAVAGRHRRPTRGVVVGVTLLLGVGCGGEDAGDRPASPSSSTPPTMSLAATEPLQELLLWLLSPTGECPPSGFVLVQTSEDPTLALLQALGIESNTRPVCPRAQESP